MRNPENVLNSLSEHSRVVNYKFERLYRILYNEKMYYLAYQRIYAKPGIMTRGVDGSTMDSMSLSRLKHLIVAIKNETYQPALPQRTNIPTKKGVPRLVLIPPFDDKLVQEVITMILEAIFEKRFEDSSHGFRPQRNCHTALRQVKANFRGVKWFIGGDIKGFFNNTNHDVLVSILKERISDDRFIRLVRKFLNAGYVEDWICHKTYSGAPQGGVISPVLANIYLDKLDKYMERYIEKFDKGKKRKQNPQYKNLQSKRYALVRKLKVVKDNDVQKQLIEKIKSIEKQLFSIPYSDEMDVDFRRVKYVRYADVFLVGLIGGKKDCEEFKREIKSFLFDQLKVALSDEKTPITHSETPARFLGYDIQVHKSSLTKRDRGSTRVSRISNERVILKMPPEVVKKKLIEYGAVQFNHHNGHEIWKAHSRAHLLNKDDWEILNQYNSEIQSFYNYYSIAVNVRSMNSFKHIMEYSMYKTFARKYQMSVRQVCRTYKVNGDFTVYYTNKKGEQKRSVFYNKGFSQKK